MDQVQRHKIMYLSHETREMVSAVYVSEADYLAQSARIAELERECERLDAKSQQLSDQLGACDRERRAFRDDRDQLRAELEACRKDAERYRWLRDQCHRDWDVMYTDIQIYIPGEGIDDHDDLDAAIDDAMQEQAQPEVANNAGSSTMQAPEQGCAVGCGVEAVAAADEAQQSNDIENLATDAQRYRGVRGFAVANGITSSEEYDQNTDAFLANIAVMQEASRDASS